MSEDKTQERRYGGIEAGGTKFVCAIGTGASDLQAVAEIPTGQPESTIAEVVRFFRSQLNGDGKLAGLGIGSFGPVELNEDASDYGFIKATPKAKWHNVDIRGEFARALDVPVAIDTDVNVAAVGEMQWGAARDLQHCLYVTVGTGIGVGAIVDGRIFIGAQHPEMGHMLVPVSFDEPGEFAGVCPYHQSCAEGLASGTAIVRRWGSKLCDLPENHPAWDLEAHYLAVLMSNLTFSFQPQRIIVGGGVMNEALIGLTRDSLHKNIAGYRHTLAAREAMDDYLVLPELDGRAGVLGAISMAVRESLARS